MFSTTTGKLQTAQKIVVYGPEGIGKSTFASHFPTPLFIDTEGSTKLLDVTRMDRPSSWAIMLQRIKEFITWTKAEKADGDYYKTLVIDTADWAEQLCIAEICSKAQKSGIEEFGYGKGYVYLAEEFGRLLNLLEDVISLGVNVLLVAHAQMRKFEQPDEMGAYDRWELKLQKKTAPLVMEWADMVLFANFKTYVVNVDGQGTQKGKNKAQGNKRVMYTAHHQCWDAKNRHGLKDELPFDFAEIAEIIFAPISNFAVPPSSTAGPTTPTPDQVPEKKEEQRPSNPESPASPTPPLPADEGIPKSLLDLMEANDVKEDEIKLAVGSKGYYPYDTPIQNYDPDFIAGVLVAAWDQVFGMIKKDRAELPFK